MKYVLAATLALVMVSPALADNDHSRHHNTGRTWMEYGESNYGKCKHQLGHWSQQPPLQTTPNPASEQARMGIKPGEHPFGDVPSCHHRMGKKHRH